MQKERSLQSLLRDHKVSADEFFQAKGIAAQIRTSNSMSRFVKYCRTHRNFATRMIYLALNVSCSELEDPRIKKAAFSITQLLGNEETQLIDLFFETDLKTSTENTEIPQELQNSIQSEAQRLFMFESEDQQSSAPQQPRSIQITGRELVDLTFQILKNPTKNQTCLGHLQKIFSFFIRHDPILVLAHFEQRPQIIKLLINNLSYSSISSLLAQILTSQDKKRQYKYQALKKNILIETIEAIFSKIEDQNYFDGAIVFLQEILTTSKQSYYEFFEDFKRIANYLVSAPVLTRFFDQLVKLNQLSFSCISKFLQSLFFRMNTEAQDSAYYDKEEQTPSMNFQIEVFIKNISTLILLVPRIHTFNSLTKISYLSFLEALLNSSSMKSSSFDLNHPSFQGLFDAYKNQKKGGIVKSKIYSLINKFLNKSSQEQIRSFLQQHPNIYSEYFGVIQAANYSNTKIYNKNQRSGFDVSLIIQLTRKQQQALSNVSALLGKDFKRISKKYQTKIANSQKEQQEFVRFDSQNTNKSNAQTGITNLLLNFVGKNNISIPLLNLPDKNNISCEQHSQERQNQSKELRQNQRLKQESKEVVQEEEVVVLTGKLDKFQLINENATSPQAEVFQLNHKHITQKSEKTETPKAEKNQKTFSLQILNLKSNSDSKKITDQKSQSKAYKDQENSKKMPEDSGKQERVKFFTRHLKLYA